MSKDVATRVVEEYIQNQKKRKQIFSITLDQGLYDDAMQVAPDGNFSKCVTVALEEFIDRKVAEGLPFIDKK